MRELIPPHKRMVELTFEIFIKTKSLKIQLNSLYIKVIMLIGKIIQSTLFSSGGGQNTQDMDILQFHRRNIKI